MHQTPLDDPTDYATPKRAHMLTWWMVGLGMGIVLLAVNFLDQAGYLPAVLGLQQDWVTGLLFLAVLVAGPLLLSHLLERAEPGITPRRTGFYALSSGVLAASIFLFLKMVTAPMHPNFDRPTSVAIFVITGGFCGLVGSAYTTFLRERGWWLWLLALLAWTGAALLLLGSPLIKL